MVTEQAIPLAIGVSPANRNEASKFFELIEAMELRSRGRGRAKRRPLEIIADGAYDNGGIREYLRRRGIKGNITGNERSREKPRVGRPRRFHELTYRVIGW